MPKNRPQFYSPPPPPPLPPPLPPSNLPYKHQQNPQEKADDARGSIPLRKQPDCPLHANDKNEPGQKEEVACDRKGMGRRGGGREKSEVSAWPPWLMSQVGKREESAASSASPAAAARSLQRYLKMLLILNTSPSDYDNVQQKCAGPCFVRFLDYMLPPSLLPFLLSTLPPLLMRATYSFLTDTQEHGDHQEDARMYVCTCISSPIPSVHSLPPSFLSHLPMAIKVESRRKRTPMEMKRKLRPNRPMPIFLLSSSMVQCCCWWWWWKSCACLRTLCTSCARCLRLLSCFAGLMMTIER